MMKGEGVGSILPKYVFSNNKVLTSSSHQSDTCLVFDQIKQQNDEHLKKVARQSLGDENLPLNDRDGLMCAIWGSCESPILKRRKRAGSLDTESLSEDHSVITQNTESQHEFFTETTGSWIGSVLPDKVDNLMRSEDEVVKVYDESFLPSVVESGLFADQSTSTDLEEEMMENSLPVSIIKGKVEIQSDFDRLLHTSNTKEFRQKDEIKRPFICPIHGACPDLYPSLFEDVLFSPHELICDHTSCSLSKEMEHIDKMRKSSPSDFLKRKSKPSTKRKMNWDVEVLSSDLKMEESISKCVTPDQLLPTFKKISQHQHYRSHSKPLYEILISSNKPSVVKKLISRENNKYIRPSNMDAIFSDQPTSVSAECLLLHPSSQCRLLPHEIGFSNLGNTCFVNSTLQVLLALPEFIKNFHENCQGRTDLPTSIKQLDDIAESRKLGDSVLVQKNLQNFISDLWQLNEAYLNGDQHDANEFLLRLMAVIRSSLPNGPIEKFFEFDMVEIHECLKCGEVTKRVRHESNLCLPIGLDSHNIEQCLESYLEDEERSITCDMCQGRATKVSNKFLTFPRNLVLTLNRYSKEEKIMQFIRLPDVIDLRKFLEKPENFGEETEFKMVGKITHLGNSKFSGHYICDVLCEDGSWRSYNDENVSSIPLKCKAESLDDPAYIFFFSRQESSEPVSRVQQ